MPIQITIIPAFGIKLIIWRPRDWVPLHSTMPVPWTFVASSGLCLATQMENLRLWWWWWSFPVTLTDLTLMLRIPRDGMVGPTVTFTEITGRAPYTTDIGHSMSLAVYPAHLVWRMYSPGEVATVLLRLLMLPPFHVMAGVARHKYPPILGEAAFHTEVCWAGVGLFRSDCSPCMDGTELTIASIIIAAFFYCR